RLERHLPEGTFTLSRTAPFHGAPYTQSPWCAGLVGHHGDNALARIALDTSIGVSGRCDFTSAPCRSSACKHAAAKRGHRLPTSRVETIARNAPLVEVGWRQSIIVSGKTKGEYF
ncbi:hypothetical protein, partial [Bradyrhizobium sp. SZCCHNPS1003]|uniref:hypothetical protein n=1 Tax=Bradyrhizobium sp. SZCCHNPS1003 TaxID=3057330 RepID=UPI0028E63208